MIIGQYYSVEITVLGTLEEKESDCYYFLVQKAGDLIKQDLRSLRGRRVAFLTGDSGILALGAWYFTKIGRADKCEKCVNE